MKTILASLTRLSFWDLRRKENNDEVLQGKFVTWSFHFPSSIFSNFYSSFVYFIGAFKPHKGGDFPKLPQF